MDVLQIRDLTKIYQADNGEIQTLEPISFSLREGELISIVGPSGCGKSTLLSMIAGILPTTKGEILLKGEPVREVSSRVGYMLQRDNLLPWRTIYQNVMLGLELTHQRTAKHIERADSLLQTYGLYEFKDHYPSQISGGMRQRVALIRTLAINPDLLLLDEAFSALDFQTRLSVTDDVFGILKQEKISTIMVTHDIPESISMGDRVIILTSRPARIQEIVEIELEEGADTPMKRRSSPKFQPYFDHIWKVLEQV